MIRTSGMVIRGECVNLLDAKLEVDITAVAFGERLRAVAGPVLGPFDRRSEALRAEQAWLRANWLVTPD